MAMIENEETRQRAAYATSISTLDSTDESLHNSDSEYDADDILAQRVHDGDNEGVVQYLVKYTDYPMHRCTWEPIAHLRPQLFQGWKNKGITMGTDKRNQWSLENVRMFDEAVARANAARAKRREKRKVAREEERARKAAKKEERENATKKKGVARRVPPSNRTQHTPATESKRKSSDSSRHKRPIVTSSDDDVEGQMNSPVESSDNTNSDDEPLRKLLVTRKVAPGHVEGRPNTTKLSRPSSPLPTQKPSMTIPVSESSDLPTAQHEDHKAIQSSTLDKAKQKAQQQGSTISTRSQSGNSSSVASLAVQKTSVLNNPSNAREPRDPGPIRIVNEPKPAAKIRKIQDVKHKTDKPFQTLKWRGLAEKRSRIEGTPDFNQLHFVNRSPAEASKAPAESISRARNDDNPYGRREPGQERTQISIPDDHSNQTKTNYALRSYEKEKIPMACYEWSRGLTCDFGPERCHFLHRENDEAGNPLSVNNRRGVPPKHWDQPEMCLFWFRDGKCKYTAIECSYAHENTGFLPVGGDTNKTQPVDRGIQPGSAEAREICVAARKQSAVGLDLEPGSTVDKLVHRSPTSSTTRLAHHPVNTPEDPIRKMSKHVDSRPTCYFWLRGPNGCTRSDETCKFAHENTGQLAVLNGPNELIDPKEVPIAPSLHQYAFPALNLPYSDPSIPPHLKTCFFWNEYMCKKPQEICLYLHQYTGVVADPPRQFDWQNRSTWQKRLRDEPKVNHSSQTTGTTNGLNVSKNPGDHSSSISQQGSRSAPIRAIQSEETESKFESQLSLDFKEMFSCNGGQKGDLIAEPNALLLYNPEQHTKEHDIITRWLSSNHVENVFRYWTGIYDEWNGFKELILAGGSGIIVAHPDFEHYSILPGFSDVLRGTVRLWAVGGQEVAGFNIWNSQASKNLHVDRFEIFPHGGVIYITDDVFLKTPQLALKIVEHFIAMVDAGRKVDGHVVPGMYVNDGILLWRLGVRPDLLRWIGDICMNHQSELEQGDPDINSLNQLYVLLTDSKYCEPDSSITDLPLDNSRLDYYPIISTRQDFAEEIGLYYKERESSQHDANTEMAHHYSGLVVVERRLYRHYFVVHTEPQQVDWKETITNIDEIMTPERCIEYFEQDAKGNRFDDYAWTYPKKREDSATF